MFQSLRQNWVSDNPNLDTELSHRLKTDDQVEKYKVKSLIIS